MENVPKNIIKFNMGNTQTCMPCGNQDNKYHGEQHVEKISHEIKQFQLVKKNEIQ